MTAKHDGCQWREREVALDAPHRYESVRGNAYECVEAFPAGEARVRLQEAERWAWQVDLPAGALPMMREGAGGGVAEEPDPAAPVVLRWLEARCPECGNVVRLDAPRSNDWGLGDGEVTAARAALQVLGQPALPFWDGEALTTGAMPREGFGRECPACHAEVQIETFSAADGSSALADRGASLTLMPRPAAVLRELVAVDGLVERVEVRTVEFGRPMVVALDLASGLVEVDGETFLKSANRGLDALCCELTSELMVCDRAVVRAAAEAAGRSRLGPATLPAARIDDWAGLAARLRFVGYPEDFYDDVRRLRVSDDNPLFGCECNLPRRYEDVAGLYARTGLPDCKSIRRAAFERPIYLAIALAAGWTPVENVDILRRFMAHPSGPQFFAALADGVGAKFWRRLVGLKGEAAVWRWLEGRGPGDLPDGRLAGSLARPGVDLGRLVDEYAPDRRISSIVDAVAPMAFAADPHRWGMDAADAERPYGYGGRHLSLPGRFGGFDFSLPAKPAELVGAGSALRNCLGTYARKVPDEAVVVLVSFEGRLAAAIELDRECGSVMQVRGACNATVVQGSDLGRAVVEWAAQRDVSWRSGI